MRGDIEAQLIKDGSYPAGVDEVGRGCLAGDVYAACVILDYKKLAKLDLKTRGLIRDSKKLSHLQRKKIIPIIQEISLSIKVCKSGPREIEKVNILEATFLAMRRAAARTEIDFDILLVDGNQKIKGYDEIQRPIIKGDEHCYAIAAASILAKEARDNSMKEAAKKYPVYGFESHVGYGTAKHLDMVKEHGICDLHRRTFGPIKKYIEKNKLRFNK
jgi:ribonuclease HII